MFHTDMTGNIVFPYRVYKLAPCKEVGCQTLPMARTVETLLNIFGQVNLTKEVTPVDDRSIKLLFWLYNDSQPILGYYIGNRFWKDLLGHTYLTEQIEKWCHCSIKD